MDPSPHQFALQLDPVYLEDSILSQITMSSCETVIKTGSGAWYVGFCGLRVMALIYLVRLLSAVVVLRGNSSWPGMSPGYTYV